MSAIFPTPLSPSAGSADDVRESAARIRRWSRFLSLVGILSIVVSVIVSGVLWLDDDPMRKLIAFAVMVSAVVTAVPTARMYTMSRAFGRVAYPATVGMLVQPLRSLRTVLFWFVTIGAIWQAIILGAVLVRFAVPGVMESFGFDKPGRTVREMREIAVAIDEFARERHAYPDAADISQLREQLLLAGFGRHLAENDAWGRPFQYRADRAHLGPSYTLMSLGADGVRQDPDIERMRRDAPKTTPEDRDIVIESGVFVEGPEESLGIIPSEVKR